VHERLARTSPWVPGRGHEHSRGREHVGPFDETRGAALGVVGAATGENVLAFRTFPVAVALGVLEEVRVIQVPESCVVEVLTFEGFRRVGLHDGGPSGGVVLDQHLRQVLVVAAEGGLVEPEQLGPEPSGERVTMVVAPPPALPIGVGDGDGSACAHFSSLPVSCPASAAAPLSWAANSWALAGGRGTR